MALLLLGERHLPAPVQLPLNIGTVLTTLRSREENGEARDRPALHACKLLLVCKKLPSGKLPDFDALYVDEMEIAAASRAGDLDGKV